MKSTLIPLAIPLSIAVLLLSPQSSARADGDIPVSLAEAQRLLEGLPDLEGKSEEEVRRIIESSPDIRRRIEQAEAKVQSALDEMGVGQVNVSLEQALKELESIPELQGKTDEEMAAVVAGNPEVRRRISSVSRRITAAVGGNAGGDSREAGGSDPASAEKALVPDEVEPDVAIDNSSTNVLDDVFFGEFEWVFGGFKGDRAQKCDVQISGLSMKRDGLSFKYVEDLSSWGLSHDDAGALACLFVCDNDGRWVGGKFDWISSSRKTRDFKNIYSGYEGWSLRNVPNPCAAAFVIVSKDGRKRSNVITAMWER